MVKTLLAHAWFRFGIIASILFAALSPARLPAQQQFMDAANSCDGNADCASYRGDLDLLLHQDDQRAASTGKRPENRSHILLQADMYLQQHLKDAANAAHFRYLNCVSEALWSERGESKTLFSVENIVATYFALEGRDGGIEHMCELLGVYKLKFERAREDREILQRKFEVLNPEEVWHAILIDSTRKQTPNQSAEADVKRDQERYCLFAIECMAAENSPFARKPTEGSASGRAHANTAPRPDARGTGYGDGNVESETARR
jgi:hypothetical protein